MNTLEGAFLHTPKKSRKTDRKVGGVLTSDTQNAKHVGSTHVAKRVEHYTGEYESD